MGSREDIISMISRAIEGDEVGSKAELLPPRLAKEALRKAGERYVSMYAGNRFKVGDWVTPAPDSKLSGGGRPHLVVATLDSPQHRFVDKPGTPNEGLYLDIRVLQIADGHNDVHVLSYWSESADYVPYTADIN